MRAGGHWQLRANFENCKPLIHRPGFLDCSASQKRLFSSCDARKKARIAGFRAGPLPDR